MSRSHENAVWPMFAIVLLVLAFAGRLNHLIWWGEGFWFCGIVTGYLMRKITTFKPEARKP